MRGQPLTIFGDGSQTRDFLHVADAVAGPIAALQERSLRSRAFNIAGGKETTILELAQIMQETAGATPGVTFERARKGNIHRSIADITVARRELNFRPTVSLNEGLAATIQWFAQDN